MLSKQSQDNRYQTEITCIDQLVPQDHLLRKINETVDFSFIYDLVEDLYSKDNGRPSLDPVQLIKMPILQYLYGIRSMRQTIKEIEVNVAYRWFLGLSLHEDVPHFTTFGKNYHRRFAGTDIFDKIFQKILDMCRESNLVDESLMYIDSTPVKAHANKKKYQSAKIEKKRASYQRQLLREVNEIRVKEGKKPFDDDDDGSGCEEKEIKQSTQDPESGWFHKGEHQHNFSYSVSAACDKNGWITAYFVAPGNEHDSTTFQDVYEKLEKKPEYIGVDAGYVTPNVMKRMKRDDVQAVIPYRRPHGKKGYIKPKEFVYDEYYDCYLCPENKVLEYRTTNRKGYREYQSDARECKICPRLFECTQNKKHTKLVVRHIWKDSIEDADDFRLTPEGKEMYAGRKESIERIFGTAKEYHGFRYTNMIGKAKMVMKTALTFTCMNLKKLVRARDLGLVIG